MTLARGLAGFAFAAALLIAGAAEAQAPKPAQPQAQQQVQQLGDLSFAVPDGWKVEPPQAGAAQANLVWTNANGAYAVIVVARPIKSTGDAEKDFALAWRSVVEPDTRIALPSPIYDIRGMMGYPGKYSGGAIDNRTKEVALYVLGTGASFVPVAVVGPNRAVLDALYETVRAVIGSVRLAPLVAVPIKTTVSTADLVGDWRYGDASVVNYVNTTTGAYVGSSTTFSGEYYTIAADGRYSFSFQGMSGGRVIRDKAEGVVEFSGEFIVFHEKPSDRLTRYRFIAYEQGLAGGTLLTLLAEAYPVTSANIALYGSRFAREPLKR